MKISYHALELKRISEDCIASHKYPIAAASKFSFSKVANSNNLVTDIG